MVFHSTCISSLLTEVKGKQFSCIAFPYEEILCPRLCILRGLQND